MALVLQRRPRIGEAIILPRETRYVNEDLGDEREVRLARSVVVTHVFPGGWVHWMTPSHQSCFTRFVVAGTPAAAASGGTTGV